jgi:5-methylcytosine-specific restriction endonuclease McrA
MLATSEYPALLLNADFRPMSVAPLSTVNWEDSVKGVFLDKFMVVAEYDRVIRSPSFEMRLPSVIALKDHVSQNRPASRTRWAVFLRDDFKCCFCGHSFPTHELTFDHVIPRSRGGDGSFLNLVTACLPCNMKKGDKTPQEAKMPLLRKPYHPTKAQLNAIGMKYAPQRRDIHQTWMDFLYWDTPLIA